VAVFALDSELTVMNIFMTGDALCDDGFVTHHAFFRLMTLRAFHVVFLLQFENVMVEFSRLESIHGMARFTLPRRKMPCMQVLVTISAFRKFLQFPLSRRMAFFAGHNFVAACQWKFLVLNISFFPRFCIVATRAIISQSAVMFVFMAGKARLRRQTFEYLVLMAGDASHGCVRARKRVLRCAVIERHLLHRSVYRMAGFALRKLALVFVLVTGRAGCRQTEKRTLLVAGRAVFDFRMQSIQFPAGLRMVEILQIKRADIEVATQMLRMATDAGVRFICVKSFFRGDPRRKIFVAIQAFRIQDVLIVAMA
jgi:hypothetical protein